MTSQIAKMLDSRLLLSRLLPSRLLRSRRLRSWLLRGAMILNRDFIVFALPYCDHLILQKKTTVYVADKKTNSNWSTHYTEIKTKEGWISLDEKTCIVSNFTSGRNPYPKNSEQAKSHTEIENPTSGQYQVFVKKENGSEHEITLTYIEKNIEGYALCIKVGELPSDLQNIIKDQRLAQPSSWSKELKPLLFDEEITSNTDMCILLGKNGCPSEIYFNAEMKLYKPFFGTTPWNSHMYFRTYCIILPILFSWLLARAYSFV